MRLRLHVVKISVRVKALGGPGHRERAVLSITRDWDGDGHREPSGGGRHHGVPGRARRRIRARAGLEINLPRELAVSPGAVDRGLDHHAAQPLPRLVDLDRAGIVSLFQIKNTTKN